MIKQWLRSSAALHKLFITIIIIIVQYVST